MRRKMWVVQPLTWAISWSQPDCLCANGNDGECTGASAVLLAGRQRQGFRMCPLIMGEKALG